MLNDTLTAAKPLLAHWPASSDWTPALQEFFLSECCQSLSDFVCQQRLQNQIFPPTENVFNAFRYCPLRKTRVVVLGQDPYHRMGQAHGLCFSVPNGVKAPPSLKNIFIELQADLGIEHQGRTDLTNWARQGVLLLNTVLTVQDGLANSHRKRGWESFTDLVIEKVSAKQQTVVFVLWGKPAAKKAKLIASHHQIIESPHPSPLSAYRGFFGSKPFSRINALLRKFDESSASIDWRL